MNKKGNIFFGVMIACIIWFFGIWFMPYIYDTQISTLADLRCSLSNITYGNMGACIMVSVANPYFILTIISLAVGYIVGSIK
jgi:hypothetical protein